MKAEDMDDAQVTTTLLPMKTTLLPMTTTLLPIDHFTILPIRLYSITDDNYFTAAQPGCPAAAHAGRMRLF
jgi:hypothetical protein